MESSIMIIVIMFSIMMLLLAVGLEIAFATGIAGLVALFLWHPGVGTWEVAGLIAWNNTNSFVLTALPMFVFMSAILQHSGIMDRMFEAVSKWLSWLPGSLAVSAVTACGIFAALCGSSVVTAASVGTASIPQMQRRGYDARLATGCVAAGGLLGILIPPSVPMVFLGLIMNASIGKLFIAGVIPGIILMLSFAVFIILVVHFKPSLAPKPQGVSWSERFPALTNIAPVLLVIAATLGGIYAGIVTVSEAAAVGAFMALLVTLAQRRLNFGVLKTAAWDAARFTCMAMFILVASMIVSQAMAGTGFGNTISQFIESANFAPWQVFLFIAIIYLILGMLMDSMSAVLITLPVFYPIAAAAGFDPIWFGVEVVILIELGLITPPFAMNIFVIQNISGNRVEDVIAGTLPFVALAMGMVALLWFVPSLAMWLPSTMAK